LKNPLQTAREAPRPPEYRDSEQGKDGCHAVLVFFNRLLAEETCLSLSDAGRICNSVHA
jgi:hypothetical protein